jgi:hypothetical protein
MRRRNPVKVGKRKGDEESSSEKALLKMTKRMIMKRRMRQRKPAQKMQGMKLAEVDDDDDSDTDEAEIWKVRLFLQNVSLWKCSNNRLMT